MFFRNLETQKNIIMDNIEECDYGFFCDLETEQIIVYPKQKIGFINKHNLFYKRIGTVIVSLTVLKK